jgi:signal transduction histidine kinase
MLIDANRLLADARASVARAPVPEELALARGAPDRALDRFAALYGVALRLGTVGLGGIAAALSLAAPASMRWLLPALCALGLWCLVFLSVAVRRGLTHRLVIADSLIVCVALLLQGHLVSAAEIPNSSAWLLPIATAAVLLAQLRLRPLVGVPLGLLVSGAHVAGQALAIPLRPLMLIGAAILVIQTGLGAATVQLVRRAGRAAELECDRQALQDQESQVAAARRADEREQFRQLHDTALATLTMVGSGSVRSGSGALHARAADDAAALRALSSRLPTIERPERLDTCLLAVIESEAADGLEVAVSLPPVSIRGDVLRAVAASVGEALRNIARHAGVDAASVKASVDDSGRLRVDIRDHGRGFDVHTVGAHSRGVRESILGRMADVGGDAEVRSTPTDGTLVVLRWGADDRR